MSANAGPCNKAKTSDCRKGQFPWFSKTLAAMLAKQLRKGKKTPARPTYTRLRPLEDKRALLDNFIASKRPPLKLKPQPSSCPCPVDLTNSPGDWWRVQGE